MINQTSVLFKLSYLVLVQFATDVKTGQEKTESLECCYCCHQQVANISIVMHTNLN